MMAAAAVDVNQKIISTNLDMLEEQRGQMHRDVDQYVDKVKDAVRRWTARRERSHATFVEIHNITSKAMLFLSLKCEEMKSELENETSDLIGRDVFIQHQENAQMDSPSKPATTHGKGYEDDTDVVRNSATFTNLNLESDQQTRYQDVYNQLQSVLAKQNKLEQQLNTQINNLREDTESLKSDVGTFNQYVETGKSLLKDYSQKLESLENTVSCLSGNVNEMHSDHQVLVDRINSHLSAKDDRSITDLSAKVDQITTDLTEKVDRINKDVSAKVDQLTTGLSARVFQNAMKLSASIDIVSKDLSDKIDQIKDVLQSLTNSEKEHAAQKNKIAYLEKHFNTIEKDTQNNDKQVQQQLGEMGTNILDVTKKLTVLAKDVMKCVKITDHGAVGFSAEINVPSGFKALSVIGNFQHPTFIEGCQFSSETGIFTASSAGIYLVYVSMRLCQKGHSCVSVCYEYTEFDEHEDADIKCETEICVIETDRKFPTECKLNIIQMEAKESLFIRTSVYAFVNCQIQFLCFKIG